MVWNMEVYWLEIARHNWGDVCGTRVQRGEGGQRARLESGEQGALGAAVQAGFHYQLAGGGKGEV